MPRALELFQVELMDKIHLEQIHSLEEEEWDQEEECQEVDQEEVVQEEEWPEVEQDLLLQLSQCHQCLLLLRISLKEQPKSLKLRKKKVSKLSNQELETIVLQSLAKALVPNLLPIAASALTSSINLVPLQLLKPQSQCLLNKITTWTF